MAFTASSGSNNNAAFPASALLHGHDPVFISQWVNVTNHINFFPFNYNDDFATVGYNMRLSDVSGIWEFFERVGTIRSAGATNILNAGWVHLAAFLHIGGVDSEVYTKGVADGGVAVDSNVYPSSATFFNAAGQSGISVGEWAVWYSIGTSLTRAKADQMAAMLAKRFSPLQMMFKPDVYCPYYDAGAAEYDLMGNAGAITYQANTSKVAHPPVFRTPRFLASISNPAPVTIQTPVFAPPNIRGNLRQLAGGFLD